MILRSSCLYWLAMWYRTPETQRAAILPSEGFMETWAVLWNITASKLLFVHVVEVAWRWWKTPPPDIYGRDPGLGSQAAVPWGHSWQLCSQLCPVQSLKAAVVGVFTPQKLVSPTNLGLFLFPESQLLTAYQPTTEVGNASFFHFNL